MKSAAAPSSSIGSSRSAPSVPFRRRVPSWVLGALVASMLWTAVGTAAASDKAAAESLFNAGKELMEEERYAEACEKFAGSMDAEPSVGAQLNLALCNEKQGKVASAWSHYRQAARMAASQNDSRRQRGAEVLAAELEPRVSNVTIEVAQPLDGLRVTKDGEDAALHEALPIDPGTHRIEASAPGHRTWSQTLTIPDKASVEVITVPALEPVTTPEPVEDSAEEQPSWQVIAGWSAVGVGGLGLTIGTIFGILATSDANALESACGEDKTCPDDQLDDVDRARTRANVATGTLIVGGLFAAGGTVLLLLDPIHLGDSTSALLVPSVGPEGGSLTLTGRF